jgi:hypothetical protein
VGDIPANERRSLSESDFRKDALERGVAGDPLTLGPVALGVVCGDPLGDETLLPPCPNFDPGNPGVLNGLADRELTLDVPLEIFPPGDSTLASVIPNPRPTPFVNPR